ncbi:HNH endonuclease [Methanoculleus sp. 7T]|uniref:HNH endonuclease n=1 Tax=Methanoculleus sp. 7T TaxID=2937282 RepID=UPI0020C16791|nr:HNH endonuclease [Methanoculleus sp. 7T]
MTMERGILSDVRPGDVTIPGAYITDEVMQAVLDRQCHRCAGCNAPLAAGSTHFDLRQPVICGGAHTVGNFEALCPFCHRNLMRRIRERLAGMNDHRDK